MQVFAWLGYVKKAIAGGAAAAVAAGAVAIADGKVDQTDEALVIGAFVLGALAVFFPKNGDKPVAAPAAAAPTPNE